MRPKDWKISVPLYTQTLEKHGPLLQLGNPLIGVPIKVLSEMQSAKASLHVEKGETSEFYVTVQATVDRLPQDQRDDFTRTTFVNAVAIIGRRLQKDSSNPKVVCEELLNFVKPLLSEALRGTELSESQP